MTAGMKQSLSRTTASLWASSATWQWWESSAPACVSPPWQCHCEVWVRFSTHHHCWGFSSCQFITENLDAWQVDSYTPSISQAVCTSGNSKDLTFHVLPTSSLLLSLHTSLHSTADRALASWILPSLSATPTSSFSCHCATQLCHKLREGVLLCPGWPNLAVQHPLSLQ